MVAGQWGDEGGGDDDDEAHVSLGVFSSISLCDLVKLTTRADHFHILSHQEHQVKCNQITCNQNIDVFFLYEQT